MDFCSGGAERASPRTSEQRFPHRGNHRASGKNQSAALISAENPISLINTDKQLQLEKFSGKVLSKNILPDF